MQQERSAVAGFAVLVSVRTDAGRLGHRRHHLGHGPHGRQRSHERERRLAAALDRRHADGVHRRPSINTLVDASGRFTLRNPPSGDLTLAFTGSGIDARITISGVHANDQIRITVTVNGNAAELDEHEHEMENHEAEIEGRVASTDCSANPQTIVVGTTAPTTVNIQNARIRHDGNTLTCAQIQVNDRVEAHGTKNGTTLVATDVNVETDHNVRHQPGNDDGDGDDENEAEVNGIVAGAAAEHACPAFTFTVGATTVTTTATTKFEHTTCAGVVSGITIEAEGTKTSATALTATKVEKK